MSLCGLVGTALAAASGVSAQGANCALRNPDRQIYQIYPEATSYRSVMAIVDADLKLTIEQALGSELSIADLGKHTAYVVLKDGVPIGLVHARTEAGKRGSIELVWAMDLDMSIRDFRVQRSRDKHTDVIKSDAFREKMIGLDLAGIRGLLTAGNDDIDLAALQLPSSARSIAHTAVMCGVKTKLITELAFRDSIQPARLLGLIHRYFPQTTKVTRITSVFNDETAAALREATGGAPGQLDRGSFTILRGRGEDDRVQGVLVFAVWSAHPAHPETWWAVSREGVIRSVLLVGDVDEAARRRFSALGGKDLAALRPEADQPPDSAARCAAEVLAVLAAHDIGASAPVPTPR